MAPDNLGISADFLGVGVERIDYTKGRRERFVALRRFFERHPEYRERMVFVQLAAPSRSQIKRYQELQQEVRSTVDEVNRAVGTRSWKRIVYLEAHHDRRDIWPSRGGDAPEERALRMSRMRHVVREHNIYRWAGCSSVRCRESRTTTR